MHAYLSLCFLPLGTPPLTVVPSTNYRKEPEEPWGKKGEQDAQFELNFKVNVIEKWCSLCSAIKPSGKLHSIKSY